MRDLMNKCMVLHESEPPKFLKLFKKLKSANQKSGL